ncbi:MAG: hypothetical protein RLZZ326_3054 [Planctomycetota bacterium]
MDAFDAFKKQIMREAAVASCLINGAYSTIPTGQTFSSDIDCRVRHYVALPPRAHVHRLSAPTDGSRAHHHAEIQQLSGLLTFHAVHAWREDVFSLADKSVSLQGIYRQSGHIMRSVSRNMTHSTLRDCVSYQFARAVHWTAAQELERLIGGKSVQLPAPIRGRDVGEPEINRCVMSAHGTKTDNDYLVTELGYQPERKRTSLVWLHDEEAAKHRILIRGGLLYFATNGQLLDTSACEPWAGDSEGPFRKRLGSAGYVLNLQGDLFSGTHAPENYSVNQCMGKHPFFHSSYMAGTRVICAGRIFVEQGKLVGIDNGSGHYKPSAERLRDGIRELDRQGVPLKDLYCEDVSRTNRRDEDGRRVMLWPSAADFLAGIVGAPICDEWIQGNSFRLQSSVAEYRTSRGMLSNTSTQTQDALRVLQAVQSDSMVFCVACVWYAFSPGAADNDKRWLQNAKEFVEGKARVRLEPLEEGLSGRFSTQTFKSGLRSKLRGVLPERLSEIVGEYVM